RGADRARRRRRQRTPTGRGAGGGGPHRQAADHASGPARTRARGVRRARKADRLPSQGRSHPVTRTRALVAALLVGIAAPAAAAFPDKPIELTVLFGAGSAADLLARKLADLAARDL